MVMRTDDRRVELGQFLRSRRERLSPEDLGLPVTGRRRTPGLRREEVAQAAGVGVTWYTWLEQARDINVSAQVLDAICRALRLDSRERAHAFALARTVDGAADEPTCHLSSEFQMVLDQLDPYPAATFTWRFDIVAYNSAFRFLASDLDEIDPAERNLMWLFFTHPAWERFAENREMVARHMVAKFRSSAAHHLNDPVGLELRERLMSESAFFARVWNEHEVGVPDGRHKVFHTPVGLLRVTSHQLLHRENGANGWTTVYAPDDDKSAALMAQLSALADRIAV
ncbi:helix-turn-helix domain-containing protein [Epidermidibacterium keratini]|uniref:Helix-turn-helix domain-containing protein n=1 Tax=Epidermidibacterium keratini TaxID=1891644 RepID=A0A7L4YRG5_9ACTN|nr:helix-turn-helix transcriptional regulator [Epidermidibacterium keratini]QHC01157.1 helix-turn-helix domain-containing protein [Epidermidibacterium keratini]